MKTIFLVLFMTMHLVLDGESQVKKASITVVDYVGREAIKSQHIEEMFYDEQGNKVREVIYSHSGKKEKEIEYSYNNYGQIISRKEFLIKHSFYTETKFKYLNDNIEIPCEMRQTNSKGAVVFVVRTEFNNLGQPVKEIWFDDDTNQISSYTVFKYDDSLKIEELSYYDGELEDRVVYQYDSQSRLVKKTEAQIGAYTKITEIDYSDSLEIHNQKVISTGEETPTFTFTYNGHKNLIEEVGYNKNGDVRSRRVLSYNDDNYLISEVRYKKGNVVQKKTYEYEYY